MRSVSDDYIVYININAVALDFCPGFLRNQKEEFLCMKRVIEAVALLLNGNSFAIQVHGPF